MKHCRFKIAPIELERTIRFWIENFFFGKRINKSEKYVFNLVVFKSTMIKSAIGNGKICDTVDYFRVCFWFVV